MYIIIIFLWLIKGIKIVRWVGKNLKERVKISGIGNIENSMSGRLNKGGIG